MAKWARTHERKKIGPKKAGKKKAVKKKEIAVERAVEIPAKLAAEAEAEKEGEVPEAKGTRYSTVRKNAGTTYSPKYSPKLKLRG